MVKLNALAKCLLIDVNVNVNSASIQNFLKLYIQKSTIVRIL